MLRLPLISFIVKVLALKSAILRSSMQHSSTSCVWRNLTDELRPRRTALYFTNLLVQGNARVGSSEARGKVHVHVHVRERDEDGGRRRQGCRRWG